MDTIETRYGQLSGFSTRSLYDNGSLKSCILQSENLLQTPIGAIIPQYRVAELGERHKKHRASLEFYEDGSLKSAALDLAMPLQTPLGIFKAELVTFHEDGTLKRLFPLNGLIDGYWSEKNEGDLAEPLDFDLSVGKFTAKIISILFYPSGALKSVTLWPGQKITINTPVGPMLVRTGFSLYEDGSLRSAEPAAAIDLDTPIGRIKAFDAEMVGMTADLNSVQFCPKGSLRSLKTIHTGLRVTTGNIEAVVEPLETTSLVNLNGLRTVPMKIDFEGSTVGVFGRTSHRFDTATHTVVTFDRKSVIRDSCGSACSHAETAGSGCGSTASSCSSCDGGPSCCKNK